MVWHVVPASLLVLINPVPFLLDLPLALLFDGLLAVLERFFLLFGGILTKEPLIALLVAQDVLLGQKDVLQVLLFLLVVADDLDERNRVFFGIDALIPQVLHVQLRLECHGIAVERVQLALHVPRSEVNSEDDVHVEVELFALQLGVDV